MENKKLKAFIRKMKQKWVDEEDEALYYATPADAVEDFKNLVELYYGK